MLVRWASVEAIQRNCERLVRQRRGAIEARRGRGARNIAKVAAAQRMLDIVFYVLRNVTARALSAAA